MAIFPAVLVDNLPRHLQHNTKKAASVLLGQNRKEMMFWRLHTDAPNFLVVFRDAEQRNAFFHSPFLQEVHTKITCWLLKVSHKPCSGARQRGSGR